MSMRDFLPPHNTARRVCHCHIAKWCNRHMSQSHFAQDDRTLGAAILHQVLSETWGYPSGNNLQNSPGFWPWCNAITQIKEWFNHFKDGRMSVDIKLCANLGKSVTETWQWLDKRLGKRAWAIQGCLNGMLGSGQTEKDETVEEQCQMSDSAYYCDVLQWPHKNVWRLHSELWQQKNWLLHHDNALPHYFLFHQRIFDWKHDCPP
jgi:hypothetical protein